MDSAAHIRKWTEAGRAAAAPETVERLAHPLSPKESFQRACRVRALVATTLGSHVREHTGGDVTDEGLAVDSTWVVRPRRAASVRGARRVP